MEYLWFLMWRKGREAPWLVHSQPYVDKERAEEAGFKWKAAMPFSEVKLVRFSSDAQQVVYIESASGLPLS